MPKVCAEAVLTGSLNNTCTVVAFTAVTLVIVGRVVSGGVKLNVACELAAIGLAGVARSVTLLTVNV